MKRVFAFLSAFVFALALFGTMTIHAADPEPAEGKFVVDPTLTANEIPMYIMDSIYTTFPNFYDNVAKPDAKFQAGRLYPWNETRILVPQFAAGEPTGKVYSVYFVGGLTFQDASGSPINQAGNNRQFVAATMTDKIVYQTGFEATEPAAFAPATVYNNAAAATQGTGDKTWDMIYGTVSTTGPIVGAQSAQMRWYTSAPTVTGSLVSNFSVTNVDKVMFKAAQTEGLKVKVTHSVDGGDFVGAQVFEPGLTSTELSYTVNKTGQVKIKFEVELPAVLPTATSRLYIDDVRIVSGKQGATSANQTGTASASLSFLRMNNLGGDVWYNTLHEPDNNAHVAYLLFSKEGKAIRGIAPASSITNKYCFAAAPATGLIPVVEGNVGCEMLLDGEGNPTGPKYFLGRIVWDAQVNPTANPELFNTNGYLGAGWDAHKWDFYNADAGIAWSFYAGGDGNFGVMTADEIAFHNAQVENVANQLAAGARRRVVQFFNFPDKALFYTFAFLDRGVMMPQFLDMYWTAMTHGRNANYTMQFKTYNFSPQAVIPVNSGALIPMENITPVTIEVLQNSTFIPRNNLNFDALGKYWGTPNTFTGFVSDLTKLEHTVTVNGATVSMPALWATKADMITAFFAEWNTWVIANRSDRYGPGKTIETITLANAYAERYSMISETSGANMWWHHDRAAAQKWMFLISFISNVRASQTPTPLAVTAFNTTTLAGGVTISSGTVMNELLAYFTEQHRTAWPATSNYTVGYTGLPGAMGVGGTRGLGSLTYSINTTGKDPGFVYNVDYQVKNTESGAMSTLRIKFVVTTVYTPRIQVNNLALLKSQGDAFNIRNIATATDGYGQDISQYLVFSTNKEINPKSLQAGTYPITISIVDQYYGIKRAEKQVFLKVADLTAPQVSTRNLVLPFGALFNIRDGFVSAFDNVDGNLLGAQDYNPFVQMSDPIPANRAGLYVIEYEVYDRTGNATSGMFTVRILADYQTEIMTKLNTLSTTAQMNTMKTELLAALATLDSGTEADILAARNHLAGLIGDLGDDVDTSVAGAKTALETLINSILADLEVTVVEAVEAIPAQDNTATIVTGSAATVSSLGVGAGVILLLLKRR
jgi:hypothetical protein